MRMRRNMCRSKKSQQSTCHMDHKGSSACGPPHRPVAAWLSVDRQLTMRENIPAKPEEHPSPLAVVPTAAVVAVEEQGERAASWWFEHANSLVTAWRREQYPDRGKAASLRENVELQSYLVCIIRCVLCQVVRITLSICWVSL